MKQVQRGFTLIELVMVIVILGILAAVALPKFVNLSDDAKLAARQGLAGAITSACAINFAKHQISSGTALYPDLSSALGDVSVQGTIDHTATNLTFTAGTATTPCFATAS